MSTGWDQATAIGTLALAAVTFIAVLVTIIITVQDRRRADTRLRSERLWSDAEAVANSEVLLADIDPQPRTMNAGQPSEVQVWADLSQRLSRLEAQLKVIASAHPSDAVRTKARSLSPVLWQAYVRTRVWVAGIINNIPDPKGKMSADAQKAHAAATAAVGELKTVIESAGAGTGAATRPWISLMQC